MKPILFFITVSLFSFCCSAAEEGLLFHADFDSYLTHASFAKGSKKAGGIPADLQLRMFNGAASRNAVVLENKTERVIYALKDNFNPSCGTVSLWVKPENWYPDTKSYKVFFQIREPGFTFLIYKPREGQYVSFFIQRGKKIYSINKNIANWKPGEWHKLDAVWDSSSMRFYVDGKSNAKTMGRKFGADFKMPLPFKNGSFTLDEFAWWGTKENDRTAYDEVKIYDRILSGTEILAAYEKVIPPKKKMSSLPVPVVTIPHTDAKIVLDGKMGKQEWQNASLVSVTNQPPQIKDQKDTGAEFYLAHNGRSLFVAGRCKTPATRFSRVKRDGNLWLDDGMEIHIHGKDGKSRQYIITPSGAVYDGCDGKVQWNSSIRASSFRGKDFWSMEAELPLSEQGISGTSLKANFGCTVYKGTTPFFHSWSWLPQFVQFSSKKHAGTVILGDKKDAIRFTSLKPLEAGNLDLQLTAGKKLAVTLDIDSAQKKIREKCDGPTARFRKKLSPGSFGMLLEAKDVSGKTVYKYAFPGEVKESLTFDLLSYPAKKRFDLAVSVFLPEYKTGKAMLMDQKKILVKKVFTVQKRRANVSLPFPETLSGGKTYTVKVTLDNSPFTAEREIFIPNLAEIPMLSENDHSIPAPWSPVTVKDHTVHVLDRAYVFKTSPFPVEITSRGKKVLSAAPELVLDGKKFQWKDLKIKQKYPDHVVVTADGSIPGVRLVFRGELWFDGMYAWNMDLIPQNTRKIQNFNLTWSVPAKQAEYLMTPYYKAWKGNSMRLRYTPDEDSALIWLTGPECGLAWWCESDGNFVNATDEKQVLLTRNSQQTTVRVNMISRSAELKKTARYTMMFQATPAKRPPADWKSLETGFGHYGTNHHVNYEYATNPKADSAIRCLTTMEPVSDANMSAFIRNLKKTRNARLCIYTMPVHMASCEKEFPYLEQEWLLTPPILWNSFKDPEGKSISLVPFCPMTRVKDLYIQRTAKFLNNHPDLGGLYYDICHARSCTNPLHGCGYVDAFGKQSRRSIALGQRKYLMAIYKLHKKYNMGLLNHAHNFFYPFVHGFSDYWIPGERYFTGCSENPAYFYFEGIPLEEYQCAYNAEIRGAGIYEIIQLCRVVSLVPALAKQKKAILSREYGIRAMAPALLHNVEIMPGSWGGTLIADYRKVKKAADLANGVFHPYWTDGAVKSRTPGVYCSRYSWTKKSPYKAVLIAANSKRASQKLALDIDWKKLGIDKDQAELTNLFTCKKLSLADLQEKELKGHHFIYIGINGK